MRFSAGKAWRWLCAHPKVAIGLSMVSFFLLVGLIGPLIFLNPNAMDAASAMAAPSSTHWLGTTQTGQDVFQQVVVGTRTSLILCFGIGLAATALSVVVGMLAGYFGGLVDDVLSLFINMFLVIPALPLAVVLSSYFPAAGTTSIFIVLLMTGWPWGARVIRAQTLSLRERDFVTSASCAGESFWRIIFFEIFPNEIAIVTSSFVGTVLFAILADVGLEYIGLGDPTGTGWGTMLYWAQNSDALVQGMWWWFTAPGACVALLGAGLSLVNFGIDELANPKLRKERRPKIKQLAFRNKTVEKRIEKVAV
ncbi:MAG TPA: ABC transporter permease [Ktedonobacteraceae bacterium]|nr:ABC transporter permease [Ktedonobacteraceae bacterium]